MAIEVFLKVEGVDGECVKDGHTGEIDILSFAWGVSNAASFKTGTGGGTGQVDIGEISIMKYIDKCTPTLMAKTCAGQHWDKAKFTFRKAGGDKPVDYLVLELDKVFFTSFQFSGAGGGDQLTESCSIAFRSYKLVYTQQEQSGAPGATVESMWNVATGKAEFSAA